MGRGPARPIDGSDDGPLWLCTGILLTYTPFPLPYPPFVVTEIRGLSSTALSYSYLVLHQVSHTGNIIPNKMSVQLTINISDTN